MFYFKLHLSSLYQRIEFAQLSGKNLSNHYFKVEDEPSHMIFLWFTFVGAVDGQLI